MANRGLSASSMAAEALAEGIMNSAIPIAQADANTYKQMIFQNLSNNQQAAITNAQAYLQMDMANLSNRQQANLQNINTRQNFLLSDQAAANAAFQFNATSQNQVNQFYSKLATTVADQNAARIDAMKKFAEAEKSKINALNAQNLLNLSNFGLSALWQQWRDEASWVNTSSENSENRNHNLAMAALERSTAVDLQNKASKDAMYQMIGKFGFDLLLG